MVATTTLLNAGSTEGIAIYSTLSIPTAQCIILSGSVMENAMAATTTLLNVDMTEGTASYLNLSIPNAQWRYHIGSVMDIAMVATTTLLNADSMEGTAHHGIGSFFSSFFQYVLFAAVSVALTSVVSSIERAGKHQTIVKVCEQDRWRQWNCLSIYGILGKLDPLEAGIPHTR